MHLYSPDRPEITPGRKALLVDGSAVPIINAMPQENGKILLTVMLREYGSGELYSYSQHAKELDPNELDLFFQRYVQFPEEALLYYFSWSPQHRSTQKRTKSPPTMTAETQLAIDLL